MDREVGVPDGQPADAFVEHHYRSFDGLNLYYREYGNGPDTVLCLHGLTRNSRDFHALASRLAGRFRVLAPDVRGRGRSDRDPRPRRYHPGTYVRDVWRLLRHAGVRETTVIGTSMGGLMGLIMAEQRPRRIRGLVLNDIGPEVPSEAVQRIMSYAGLVPTAADWDEAAELTRATYEVAYPDMPESFWLEYARLGWAENGEGRPAPDVDPAVGEMLRHPPRAARLANWLRKAGLVKRLGGVALDPWEAFRALTVPCLVLRGTLSDVLTAEIVDRMLEVRPETEAVAIPNRGHTPLLDEPEAVRAIDRFLDRIHPA